MTEAAVDGAREGQGTRAGRRELPPHLSTPPARVVDYNRELPCWNERVMPLLEQAGLRKPQRARIAA